MKRSSERLIDVMVLAILLVFAYSMRNQQPGIAGVVVAAAVQFWMAKNATAPGTTSSSHTTEIPDQDPDEDTA